jgi:hypothetical protein
LGFDNSAPLVRLAGGDEHNLKVMPTRRRSPTFLIL